MVKLVNEIQIENLFWIHFVQMFLPKSLLEKLMAKMNKRWISASVCTLLSSPKLGLLPKALF